MRDTHSITEAVDLRLDNMKLDSDIRNLRDAMSLSETSISRMEADDPTFLVRRHFKKPPSLLVRLLMKLHIVSSFVHPTDEDIASEKSRYAGLQGALKSALSIQEQKQHAYVKCLKSFGPRKMNEFEILWSTSRLESRVTALESSMNELRSRYMDV